MVATISSIIILFICFNALSIDCRLKRGGKKGNQFSSGVQEHYKSGLTLAEGLGTKVVEKAFDAYCQLSGKKVETIIKFAQCDSKHAGEQYCEYASNGQMMYELLCNVLGDKGAEYFGKAMGCLKTPHPQDCLVCWFEEVKCAAEQIKGAAQMAAGQ